MDHKDLEAWKKSISLVEKLYKVTALFPRAELYGITLQIRRAAVSIASNISEGAARNSNKEFLKFLSYALGSLAEVETQCVIAERLGFLHNQNITEDVQKVRSLIIGLRKYLKCKEVRSKEVKSEG